MRTSTYGQAVPSANIVMSGGHEAHRAWRSRGVDVSAGRRGPRLSLVQARCGVETGDDARGSIRRILSRALRPLCDHSSWTWITPGLLARHLALPTSSSGVLRLLPPSCRPFHPVPGPVEPVPGRIRLCCRTSPRGGQVLPGGVCLWSPDVPHRSAAAQPPGIIFPAYGVPLAGYNHRPHET